MVTRTSMVVACWVVIVVGLVFGERVDRSGGARIGRARRDWRCRPVCSTSRQSLQRCLCHRRTAARGHRGGCSNICRRNCWILRRLRLCAEVSSLCGPRLRRNCRTRVARRGPRGTIGRGLRRSLRRLVTLRGFDVRSLAGFLSRCL